MSAPAWKWFAAAGAAVLLPFAVAWPLGGLEDAGENAAKPITMGQRVKGHRVDVVPRRAGFVAKERLVTLDLDVANVSPMPVDLTTVFLSFDVKVDGRALDPVMDQKENVILRDKSAKSFQPGMPEQVRFTWQLPEGVADARRISVAVHDAIYQPSWSLLGYSSGTSLWYKQGVVATLETGLERA
ncbi:hypothetical protein ACIBG8_30420 [Nonomuraea sp. NPDC050556]|uniref:hypothetical protein n=1 Tax=Nonomuraea sp. NPDC050556 TaxID=3364369 RepID=UPI0037936A85